MKGISFLSWHDHLMYTNTQNYTIYLTKLPVQITGNIHTSLYKSCMDSQKYIAIYSSPTSSDIQILYWPACYINFLCFFCCKQHNKLHKRTTAPTSCAPSAPSPVTIPGAERPPALLLCKLHDGPPHGSIPRPCHVHHRHGLRESAEGATEGSIRCTRNFTEPLPAANRTAAQKYMLTIPSYKFVGTSCLNSPLSLFVLVTDKHRRASRVIYWDQELHWHDNRLQGWSMSKPQHFMQCFRG